MLTATGFIDLALLVSALGCGLMAGFFFAFSACVMKALGALPPAQGIAAMQSINVAVINPWFLVPFFATAVACVVLVVASLLRWNDPGAASLLAGGLLYLVGTLAVTIAFNVPRNDALAAVATHGAEGAELWSDYRIAWTRWNHVRTLAALAAATLFALALMR